MIEAVTAGRDTELDLWRGLPEERWGSRQWWIAAGSVALHLLFFQAAVQLPNFTVVSPVTHRAMLPHTKLYLPPDLLTQRAPNKGKLSKSIDLADLLASQQAPGKQAAPRPSQKRFEVPAAAPRATVRPTPQILPDVPKVADPQQTASLPPGTLAQLPTPAPPPPKPVDSPFQNVGSEAPPPEHPTLKTPKADVQSAIQGLAQNSPGRNLVITDDNPAQPALGNLPGIAANGGPHAAVELQSDPQGADFKAYLTRILGIVRGNWRRVIPESARMGTVRGRTVVEFIINRDGSIPKLVIADSSGSDPLDRAAGAGLSMSNPLPPLPSDYRGFQVRLAFTFSYNMPAR